MTGLRWLRKGEQEHAWWQVTRDERFFCAELYFLARADLGRFIGFLNDEKGADLDPNADWELAYEAVFYRDLCGHVVPQREVPSDKRTFDLVLLSSDDILILEAKAQQGFMTEQLKSFARDVQQVKTLTDVRRVRLGALVSSKYSPKASTLAYFDGPCVNWSELAKHFDDDPKLLRADEIYGQAPRRTRT